MRVPTIPPTTAIAGEICGRIAARESAGPCNFGNDHLIEGDKRRHFCFALNLK